MGDSSTKNVVEEVIAYSDDIIEYLEVEKDANILTQHLEYSKVLQSQCLADSNDVRSLLQDYQRKIDMSKKKTDEAKFEVASDAEINLLQKELEEELQRERLLRKELRFITNKISDLEHQRVSVEERRQILKNLEQDELKAQMKLSMYASVTNVIPNLDDHAKVSGHIVQIDKRLDEMFEFDPTRTTAFDTCNSIWKMVGM
ncbi:Clathrin heavy chain linker domain-containing protein [Actinidia chinensis var. chinensis]|uniref:Clathrin heavy chain linker domain-containing protein n=1 Tax=Actinidia chinensis var. chinensis TaxID=1590841 RepID=A0A2R6RXF9_ACTCC|nr:Clathrin heavy chain linker domain-containing protein [Actinidia chinensis var. chinensis]